MVDAIYTRATVDVTTSVHCDVQRGHCEIHFISFCSLCNSKMPSVSSKDTILVRWPLYSSAIMSNFRQMRINNKLIDAILSVENKQIPVHRIVLASCSKYFDRTFESSISSIGNPTICKCELRRILPFTKRSQSQRSN